MFEVAQESVGTQQLFHDGRFQQALVRHRAQGGARGTFAQLRIAPATYQLKHLREEFDFADAAAAQLDVVAAVRVQPLLAVDLGADLAVHGADGIDDAKIEVAAEDEGPHDGVERGNVFRLARHGARLDPGIALPFAALHDQVLLHHAQAGGQRARVAVRAQGHVHAEGKAVLRDLGQGGDQFLAHANEKLMIGQAALARLSGDCVSPSSG